MRYLTGMMMNFLGDSFQNNPEDIFNKFTPSTLTQEARAISQRLAYAQAGQLRYPLLHVNLVQTLENDIRKMIEQIGPDMLRRGLSEIKIIFSKYLTEEYFTKLIKDAQLKGLSKAFNMMASPELYQSFHWTLHASSKDRFLLGDTGAIDFSEADNGWRYLPIIEGKDLRFVVLPISPSYALLGTHPNTTLPPPSPEEINRGIAHTSLASFISSEQSEILNDLKELIGSDSHPSSTEMFREWDFPQDNEWYINQTNPCSAAVSLSFEDNCNLQEKDRQYFTNLTKAFERAAGELILAEPLVINCIFTNSINETLIALENNGVQLAEKRTAINPKEVWTHTIETHPPSKFRNHVLINTTLYDGLNSENHVELLFKYFRQLFRVATDTYIKSESNNSQHDHFGIFKLTALRMQQTRLPTGLSFKVFQEVVKVSIDTDPNPKTNRGQDLILHILEDHVLYCLHTLITSLFKHLMEYKKGKYELEKLAIESEEIVAHIGISLANYFAVSTSEQRDNFFTRLTKVDVFRFAIEDEWKLIAELCDQGSAEAKFSLAQSLERILAKCGLYWHFGEDGQNDLIVGMAPYELFMDIKKGLKTYR